MNPQSNHQSSINPQSPIINPQSNPQSAIPKSAILYTAQMSNLRRTYALVLVTEVLVLAGLWWMGRHFGV
jgi:hypothetical protein